MALDAISLIYTSGHVLCITFSKYRYCIGKYYVYITYILHYLKQLTNNEYYHK